MRKSIAWLCLSAASLALAGCGGGEPAADAEPAATAKKDGAKVEHNPWAKDGAPGSEPEAAPKKKKGKKGKQEDVENPWAKESPKPAAT